MIVKNCELDLLQMEKKLPHLFKILRIDWFGQKKRKKKEATKNPKMKKIK